MCHKNPLPFILSILFFNPFVDSHVTNITHLKDFNTLINNNNVVVIKFFAPWCSFCTATEQPFEELSQQHAELQIPFAQVNIDELSELNKRYAIEALPTFILYRHGKSIKKSYRLPVIEQALKRLDSDNIGPVEEDDLTTQGIISRVIEFILMPVYFISKLLSKIMGGIVKLFS